MPLLMELVLHENVWDAWVTGDFDVADISVQDTDVVYNRFLSAISENSCHINPKDWYSLIWFKFSFSYEDEHDPIYTKEGSVYVYKTDTTTFWDLISDDPNTKDWYFTIEATSIREKNTKNLVTTSFKNNEEFKLWWSGWGWWLQRATTSPNKPTYCWCWPDADYQNLQQKYTEQENDTIYFTY